MVKMHWKLEFCYFCYDWTSRSGHELGVRVSVFAFTKILFKLTADISTRKTILEVEYFKSMIYQKLKFFKKITYFNFLLKNEGRLGRKSFVAPATDCRLFFSPCLTFTLATVQLTRTPPFKRLEQAIEEMKECSSLTLLSIILRYLLLSPSVYRL